MTVVALRLAAPLQSWGSRSRFVRRETDAAPTKSGVLGLIAAAKGLRRTDPIEELLNLRLGVRVDQPGRLLRDFQTARRPRTERDGSVTWTPLPLSQRYYMSDAVYLAVLEGEHALVIGIDAAIRRPEFPLYLGRRSCPPAGPIALGVFDHALDSALAELPWQASPREQSLRRTTTVRLATICDADETAAVTELIRDVPISFDPNRRDYSWRTVVRGEVEVPNPRGVYDRSSEHDPMTALES